MAEDKDTVKSQFNTAILSDEDKATFEFVQTRIEDLKQSRKTHYGTNLDVLWENADKEYIPHRLKTKGKKVVATDEEKGWAGSMVQLGSSEWQSDISQSNPFVKIQVALAILIDQNPSGVFTPVSKKFQATTTLIKQLYERSWEYARSKQQLKLFVFNMAKYGWAIGRTYPLRVEREVKVLTEYDPENPKNSKYEKKKVVEYNDIMRENLDPRNTWIDDMAKPSDYFSQRDWCWRKVYDFDVATEQYGKYANWKYVQPGGNTSEVYSGSKSQDRDPKNLIEIYFYENIVKDRFVCIASGVPVFIEPLPISDAKGRKKLSCWHAPWNIRHAESPYGVGIFEAIRYDQGILDRIRNMTIDQLTLSIYKMFFYSGTQALTETGDITIAPGVGKQTLDPKNISWLEVPGPGKEAWEGIENFRKDVDEASGIGDPLVGQITGKTAFEIAQAKEAALKRLKNPLDNILEALNQEGYVTLALIQLLYSIPEVYEITDPSLIADYLKEVEADPALYERDIEETEDGVPQDVFRAKVYPEFPLNLDKDEKGNLIETEETKFFRVKPKYLAWEGMINIKSQSLLVPSKQIEKALSLEMYNILIPLMIQPPEIYKKAAEDIIKLYDKDPRDILPDSWQQDAQEQPLMIPAQQAMQQQAPLTQAPQTTAPTLTSNPTLPARSEGLVGRISSGLSNLFR